MIVLEVCVDDAEGLDAAIEGGANRIELCAALELGGLTPTPGLIARAATSPVPVRMMIRPRAGDFVFSDSDLGTMLDDIAAARAAGLEGVVLGASRPDGSLDAEMLATLGGAAEGMGRTLHRAFDLVPDLDVALETAVSLGFDTILTSGRALSASEGMKAIAQVHRRAAGRITVMAGSGITLANAGAVIKATGATAIHGSCSVSVAGPGGAAERLGFARLTKKRTDRDSVSSLRRFLDTETRR